MSARPWMPLYVADYLADTAHLGALQSGAYLHLIMHYWQHGTLPVADDALMRIARLTPAEWKRERAVIASFFTDGWRHRRIEAELAHTDARIAAKSEAGRKGAVKRWQGQAAADQPDDGDDDADASAMADAIAGAALRHSDSAAQSESQTQDPAPSLRSGASRARQRLLRGTRIPQDFVPDIVEAQGLGLSLADAEIEAANFVDYWRARAVNATKLDWRATWRVWCRRAARDQPTGPRAPPRQTPASPSRTVNGFAAHALALAGEDHVPSDPSPASTASLPSPAFLRAPDRDAAAGPRSAAGQPGPATPGAGAGGVDAAGAWDAGRAPPGAD